MQAWKYTLPAFLVPIMFCLTPQGVGLLALVAGTYDGDAGLVLFGADRGGFAIDLVDQGDGRFGLAARGEHIGELAFGGQAAVRVVAVVAADQRGACFAFGIDQGVVAGFAVEAARPQQPDFGACTQGGGTTDRVFQVAGDGFAALDVGQGGVEAADAGVGDTAIGQRPS